MYDAVQKAIYYFLVKHAKADLELDNVTELTEEMVIAIKEHAGIEGMIIDVDETLRKNSKEIPRCNQDWLEMVAKHFKIVILSNGLDREMKTYFEGLGIKYIPLAFKPGPFGFTKACKSMGLKPKNVVMVGDHIVDDIFGAKINGLKSIEVNDVKDDER